MNMNFTVPYFLSFKIQIKYFKTCCHADINAFLMLADICHKFQIRHDYAMLRLTI
jgi:hypothetical protein